MDVVINVKILDENNQFGFQNFILGIDNRPNCCEYFGTWNTLDLDYKLKTCIGKDYDYSDYKRVKVKTIELYEEYLLTAVKNKDLPDKLLKQIENFYPDTDVKYELMIIAKITLARNKEIYAGVFNIHNGYYYHNVYYSENDLKIDYLDSTYSL